MGVILFAEDDQAMRAMVASVLGTAGHQVRLAPDGTTALEQVRRDPPDLVILDYRMGRPNGFEVCRQIKGDPRLAHLPVLILTAQGNVEDRIRGFDAGANDYLPKPFDARELLARVQALLSLSHQGLHRNPTTALPGGEAIERDIQRRRDRGAPLALCYLDLDQFKPFNDRFGFATADAVIRAAGEVLRSLDDPTCFVGHIGGDDFILICAPETARASVLRVQERFREQLRRHVPAEIYERGSYPGVDREGREREIPLPAVAAAILHVAPGERASLEELGEVAAAAKLRAKHAEGGIAEVELPAPPGTARR